MSKYIDTDKLIAEIEKRQEARQDARDSASWENEYWPEGEFCTRDNEDDAILSIITSLQQEQPKPKVDLVAELEHHLATTPKEQLEKEWKELEPWGNIGPTVQEFLYGKQPEVDLEKEIDKWFDMMGDSWNNGEWSTNDIRSTARHFYELGYNAGKEE